MFVEIGKKNLYCGNYDRMTFQKRQKKKALSDYETATKEVDMDKELPENTNNQI